MRSYAESLGIPNNAWAMILPHITQEMSPVVTQAVRDIRASAVSILGAAHVFDSYDVLPHGNDGFGSDVVDTQCLLGYPAPSAGEVHLNQTWLDQLAPWAAGKMRAAGYIGAAQPGS